MILGAWIRKVSVGKKAVLIHAAAANPSYPGFQKISDHEIQHASQDSAKLIKCSEGYGGLPQVNGLVLSDATSDCQPRPCAVTIPPGMTAKRRSESGSGPFHYDKFASQLFVATPSARNAKSHSADLEHRETIDSNIEAGGASSGMFAIGLQHGNRGATD